MVLPLEKTAWINLLFDFYGQLLTERQNAAIELYYGQDFSLKEIADEVSVSRQAVHVNLKRAEKLLAGYEEKLGLVAKFLDEKGKLREMADLLDSCQRDGESGNYRRAREILSDLLLDT